MKSRSEYITAEVRPGIDLEWEVDDVGNIEVRSNLEASEARTVFKALFPDWMVKTVRHGK